VPRLKIPIELIQLYPHLTRDELRAVVMTFWKTKNNKLRQSHTFKIKLPHIGTLRSHANKKPKGLKKIRKRDKKRKREQALKKELTQESLLF